MLHINGDHISILVSAYLLYLKIKDQWSESAALGCTIQNAKHARVGAIDIYR